MSHSRVLPFLAALILAVSVVLLGPTAKAAAHTPVVEVSCAGIEVSATSYDGRARNTVTVILDGETVVDAEFATAYSTTIPVLQDGREHDYEVKIWTSQDASGRKGWSKTFTGTAGPCRPTQPEPIIDPMTSERSTCATGVEVRNGTRTTTWVWSDSDSAWVQGQPTTTWGAWNKVRDLTPAEKTDLDCDKPTQPEPIVNTTDEERQNCTTGIETRTTTITTNWTWDATTWTWTKAQPVTTHSDWTKVRDLTPAEKTDLDCDKPTQPEPIVNTTDEERQNCTTGTETRTQTVTTTHVWDATTWTWTKAQPITTHSDWTTARDLTAAEKVELGCTAPSVPTGPGHSGEDGLPLAPIVGGVVALLTAAGAATTAVIRRRG